MNNIIEIKNLNYSENKKEIFKDLNMSIPEDSFISISGNNDSGKTLLIKLINGLLPSNNTISIKYSYIDNDRMYDHSVDMGTVYGSNLNSFLFEDVYKEMAFPLENLNIDPKEIEKRIIEIAKFFGITELLDKKIEDITNSDKQELLIAISLLHKPKILLLDNPFSMMENNTKKKMMTKLLEYKDKNKITIILSTNNLEEVLTSDYLYIIDKGKIVIEGKPLSVLREDTVINRVGLSLPFMVELSLMLEMYNLIDDIELDMEQLVNKLWK